MALHPGNLAPDFTVQAHNSQQVRLTDYQVTQVVARYVDSALFSREQHVAEAFKVMRALGRGDQEPEAGG